MLTQEEDVEIHALAKRGWTVLEIAHHTGRDRKTIRAYLDGVRHLIHAIRSELRVLERLLLTPEIHKLIFVEESCSQAITGGF